MKVKNVRSHFGFRNTAFAFAIESLQQMGEEVVGHLIRLLVENPGRTDRIDRLPLRNT